MAQFITVDEAAQLFGTTDRTVRRWLNDGKLDGEQLSERGKLVWRVRANKEFFRRVSEQKSTSTIDVEATTTDTDGVEMNQSAAPSENEVSNNGHFRDSTKTVAEEFWNELKQNFVNELSARDQYIGELRAQLEDRDRQLKLLPDYQRQLSSEVEEKAQVNRKVVALEKQVEIMRLEVEMKGREAGAVQTELNSVKQEREAEIEALKAEMAKLDELNKQLALPWWKKMFQ